MFGVLPSAADSSYVRGGAGVADRVDEKLSQKLVKAHVDTVRRKEKRQRAAADSTYKSKRMRSEAKKHARATARKAGVKTTSVNEETAESIVERMIADGSECDPEQLLADVRRMMRECERECTTMSKVIVAMLPAAKTVSQFRTLLKNASKKVFGGTRIFEQLATAMETVLSYVETHESREQERLNDIAELYRNVAAFRRGPRAAGGGGSFAPPVASLSRDPAAVVFIRTEPSADTQQRAPLALTAANGTGALVRAAAAQDRALVRTGSALTRADANAIVARESKQAGRVNTTPRFALRARDGGLVELRASSSDQIFDGSLSQHYMATSMARAGMRPSLTVVGELQRMRQAGVTASRHTEMLNARYSLENIRATMRAAPGAIAGGPATPAITATRPALPVQK